MPTAPPPSPAQQATPPPVLLPTPHPNRQPQDSLEPTGAAPGAPEPPASIPRDAPTFMFSPSFSLEHLKQQEAQRLLLLERLQQPHSGVQM